MKTVKTVKKASKKFVPVYTVDISNDTDSNDVYTSFALAKQRAGVPINDIEFENLIGYIADYAAVKAIKMTTDTMAMAFAIAKAVTEKANEAPKKKKNIFKRIWDKIRGKK